MKAWTAPVTAPSVEGSEGVLCLTWLGPDRLSPGSLQVPLQLLLKSIEATLHHLAGVSLRARGAFYHQHPIRCPADDRVREGHRGVAVRNSRGAVHDHCRVRFRFA